MSRALKHLIIANWKENPATLKEAQTLFRQIIKAVTPKRARTVSVVLCPPTLFLGSLTAQYKGKAVSFGVQNIFQEETGPYTGEVGATQALSARARYAIIGHSERRAMGETNALVAQKALVGLRAGLCVVICVGEKERDEQGVYLQTLTNQVLASLAGIAPHMFESIVIAYEPLWAIGKHAHGALSPHELHQTALLIRRTLHDTFGAAGKRVPILYGGSVAPENARALLVDGGVDGLLVGHQSLSAEQFLAIVDAA